MKNVRTGKKSLLMRLCLLGFAAYIAVSLVTLQMEINSKRSQLAVVSEKCEEQRLANKEIERLISLGNDKSYLARIAREKLNMGLPEEHVYKDASGS